VTVRRLFQAIDDVLGTLPTLQFRVVQLAGLDFLTFGWAVFLGIRPPSTVAEGVFNSWLLFLAALHGVNLSAYLGKRLTFKPGAPDAGGPSSDPPDEPLPITSTVTTDQATVTTKVTKRGKKKA
jgi:hypothetical protein